MNTNFKVEMKAKIEFDSEVKMYVACVPALGIWSQEETLPKAKKAIKDAVESYLVVAHEKSGQWGLELKALLEKVGKKSGK